MRELFPTILIRNARISISLHLPLLLERKEVRSHTDLLVCTTVRHYDSLHNLPTPFFVAARTSPRSVPPPNTTCDVRLCHRSRSPVLYPVRCHSVLCPLSSTVLLRCAALRCTALHCTLQAAHQLDVFLPPPLLSHVTVAVGKTQARQLSS